MDLLSATTNYTYDDEDRVSRRRYTVSQYYKSSRGKRLKEITDHFTNVLFYKKENGVDITNEYLILGRKSVSNPKINLMIANYFGVDIPEITDHRMLLKTKSKIKIGNSITEIEEEYDVNMISNKKAHVVTDDEDKIKENIYSKELIRKKTFSKSTTNPFMSYEEVNMGYGLDVSRNNASIRIDKDKNTHATCTVYISNSAIGTIEADLKVRFVSTKGNETTTLVYTGKYDSEIIDYLHDTEDSAVDMVAYLNKRLTLETTTKSELYDFPKVINILSKEFVIDQKDTITNHQTGTVEVNAYQKNWVREGDTRNIVYTQKKSIELDGTPIENSIYKYDNDFSQNAAEHEYYRKVDTEIYYYNTKMINTDSLSRIRRLCKLADITVNDHNAIKIVKEVVKRYKKKEDKMLYYGADYSVSIEGVEGIF